MISSINCSSGGVFTEDNLGADLRTLALGNGASPPTDGSDGHPAIWTA